MACLHFLLSFFTDRLIFLYVTWDFSDPKQTIKTILTCGCKMVFFLLLLLLWHGLWWFIKKADAGFRRYTLIYFAINLLLLVFTWPGIWRMDEFGIFSNAIRLQPVFWQNYLTSIFYIFSVMLVPTPAGVILVQIAINSLITGWVIRKMTVRLQKGKDRPQGDAKTVCLCYLPFLFFPVIDSNLYPMRMSVYAFLELLLIVLLYEEKEKSFRTAFLWKIAALGAVVTVWRTEAIYYLAAIPVLIVVLFCKSWTKKEKQKTILCYLFMTLFLFVPQQLGNQLTSGNEYDLTSVVLPVVPLVEEAAKHEDAKGILSKIDRVISVQTALEGAKENRSGISLYWSRRDEFVREYTDSDYRAFKHAYYRLVLKYPAVFLKERWDCFVHSTDLLENTTELFVKEGVPNYDTFRTYFGVKPVSDRLRTTVIRLLEWRKNGDQEQKRAGYGVVYSALPPILFLIAVCFALLRRKEWGKALLLATVLAKVPLIFLTAPSRLFMYYYSVYLIGYVLLIAGILGKRQRD